MAMRELNISGLPEGVVVRASSRRRKTITAFRENGQTIVVVPARMSSARIKSAVIDLVQRLEAKSHRHPPSDAELLVRTERLRSAFIPEAPVPMRVSWSARQRRRWGSCTPADRTIRISTQLRGMPDYVVDSVLFHELAHLLHADHGPQFQALLGRYPEHDRAQAYLDGFSRARELAVEELASTDGLDQCEGVPQGVAHDGRPNVSENSHPDAAHDSHPDTAHDSHPTAM